MSEAYDSYRRKLLTNFAYGFGAVGALATSVPFVSSMAPSERAKALGAPVEVDISKLEQGQMLTVAWRGKPVWILHRSEEMLNSLILAEADLLDPDSKQQQQPDYARNKHRSIRPEVLVVVGICTHLGCAPLPRFDTGPGAGLGANWNGGFFCPCHGSKFDFSGRVYKNVPAPDNLVVPAYTYLNDTRLLIGEDELS